MNPKISIIVPVYKAENYLHKCLNCIKNQTFKDWECILIDDGSPDDSGEICDAYSSLDNRFKVIHKTNSGVSYARQVGLECARGQYVIHADPDDWIEKSMLEELYHKAIEDDADMVICDFYWERNSRTIYSKQEPSSLNSLDVLCDVHYRLHGSLCNKLVKKSCFLDHGIYFPPVLSKSEDLYVVSWLLLNDIKITYLNKAFYHYVMGVNENSISQGIKQSYQYDVNLMNMFNDLLKGVKCKDICMRSVKYNVILRAFQRHDFSTIKFMLEFFSYIPDLIKYNNTTIKNKCKLIASCLGGYNIMYNLKH